MFRRVRFAFPLLLWSMAAGPAVGDALCRVETDAELEDAAGPARDSVASLIWENDAVVGEDRDYTNGVGVLLSRRPDGCAPLHRLARDFNVALERRLDAVTPFISIDPDFEPEENLVFGLAHQIYTPADLTRADPDPDDRPYAAWLYYSAAYVREHRQLQRDAEGARLGELRSLAVTQIDLGIVGPAAQGEAIQRGFHDAIDAATDPRGWDFQIGNEPGVVLRHERKLISLWDRALLDIELETHVGLALGNIETSLSAGVGARAGFNLGRDYGPPRLRPGLSGSDEFAPGDDGPVSVYLFGGVIVRAVARNIFLDGNTFRDSRSVNKKPLVADYQFGAAVVFDRVKIAVSRIHRTEEFAGQAQDSVFDSLGISFRF